MSSGYSHKQIEDVLRTVGPSAFLVHEDRIPPGLYWLGREYALKVDRYHMVFEFRRMRHRDNGPALISFDGTHEEWYQFDKLHRTDGPAVTRKRDHGTDVFYMSHGLPHRFGGPAMTYADGEMKWNWHGRLHREDGPAWIFPDGRESYYIDGFELTKGEHEDWVEKYKPYPLIIW